MSDSDKMDHIQGVNRKYIWSLAFRIDIYNKLLALKPPCYNRALLFFLGLSYSKLGVIIKFLTYYGKILTYLTCCHAQHDLFMAGSTS